MRRGGGAIDSIDPSSSLKDLEYLASRQKLFTSTLSYVTM